MRTCRDSYRGGMKPPDRRRRGMQETAFRSARDPLTCTSRRSYNNGIVGSAMHSTVTEPNLVHLRSHHNLDIHSTVSQMFLATTAMPVELGDNQTVAARPCTSVSRFGGCLPSSHQSGSGNRIAGLVAAGVVCGSLISLLAWRLWRCIRPQSGKTTALQHNHKFPSQGLPAVAVQTSTDGKGEEG